MSDVSCGKCGIVVDEPINIRRESRSPCPQCGGTTRVYGLSPKPKLVADNSGSANAAFRDVALQNTMIMQGLLTPASPAVRAIAIQAISVPWLEIVEIIHQDPRSVYMASPEKWEDIIAAAFTKAGFEQVRLALRPNSRDKDVIASKKSLGTIRIVESMKAYRPGRLVRAADLRTMWGIMQVDRTSIGIITTNSDFVPRMRYEPFILEYLPSRLELINGEHLLTILEDYRRGGLGPQHPETM